VLDDDNDTVVCGVCMGMKFIAVDLPPTLPAIPEEAWYQDPQPARIGMGEV